MLCIYVVYILVIHFNGIYVYIIIYTGYTYMRLLLLLYMCDICLVNLCSIDMYIYIMDMLFNSVYKLIYSGIEVI